MVKLGKTLREAENMTLREFTYEIYAYEKRYIEQVKLIDLQAWQNKQVQAEKKRGNKLIPYFDDFEQFSIAYRMENEKQEQDNDLTLIELLKNANK